LCVLYIFLLANVTQTFINVNRERNISLIIAELHFKLTAHNPTIDLVSLFWNNSRLLMMNY